MLLRGREEFEVERERGERERLVGGVLWRCGLGRGSGVFVGEGVRGTGVRGYVHVPYLGLGAEGRGGDWLAYLGASGAKRVLADAGKCASGTPVPGKLPVGAGAGRACHELFGRGRAALQADAVFARVC